MIARSFATPSELHEHSWPANSCQGFGQTFSMRMQLGNNPGVRALGEGLVVPQHITDAGPIYLGDCLCQGVATDRTQVRAFSVLEPVHNHAFQHLACEPHTLADKVMHEMSC